MDYAKMENQRINNRFEFPNVLDLNKYTFKANVDKTKSFED